MSADQQATRSKFAYRWAATASRNSLLYGNADQCNQCGWLEDHTHVLTCRWPCTETFCNGRINKLESKLTALSTHPDLITIVVRATAAIGGMVMFDVEGHPEELSMQRLLSF